MVQKGVIRVEEAEGGGCEDLGPPVLLAVMSPQGGAACAKNTRDCGYDSLQTCGPCLDGWVRETVFGPDLPRSLGIIAFSVAWELREIDGNGRGSDIFGGMDR
jgi:hypothetical protein